MEIVKTPNTSSGINGQIILKKASKTSFSGLFWDQPL